MMGLRQWRACQVVISSMILTASGTVQAEELQAAWSNVEHSPAGIGTVVETMDSGGYTYMSITNEKDRVWVATRPTKVKVGDKVSVPPGIVMKGFHSPSLARDFDTIWFVGQVRLSDSELPAGHPPLSSASTPPPGANTELPPGHPPLESSPVIPSVAEPIVKPASGKTVAEVYAQKQELAGQHVIVRGQVVKYSPSILGKNWVHLQDGTGEDGSDDLTLTTKEEVQVGDVVTAQGVLALDKDFGSGYRYDVILQDVTISRK